MKKSIKPLLLSALLMTGSIAFSQNGENGKQTVHQSKPLEQQTVSSNQHAQGIAKPVSTIANQHPKIADKKTVINQNNSVKK